MGGGSEKTLKSEPGKEIPIFKELCELQPLPPPRACTSEDSSSIDQDLLRRLCVKREPENACRGVQMEERNDSYSSVEYVVLSVP